MDGIYELQRELRLANRRIDDLEKRLEEAEKGWEATSERVKELDESLWGAPATETFMANEGSRQGPPGLDYAHFLLQKDQG